LLIKQQQPGSSKHIPCTVTGPSPIIHQLFMLLHCPCTVQCTKNVWSCAAPGMNTHDHHVSGKNRPKMVKATVTQDLVSS